MSDERDDEHGGLPHIRPEIAALPPYRQGKQADASAYKLSSNENPFDPLPGVIDALRGAEALNRYPDAAATRLRERLAVRYEVDVDAVHVGSGSVALLAQFIQAVAGRGDEVIYPWRSFEAYPGLVRVAGADAVEVPLTADSRHDLAAMAAAVTDRTRCILVCTPNNPTGPIVTAAEFDAFLAAVPSRVLILLDEAYNEFVTAPGAVDGLAARIYDAHPNVVVLRTFSKAFGLAALRVGYAIGHPQVLDAARSTAIPLSVTSQAETAAIVSLEHEEALRERVAEIVRRRDGLVAGLRDAGWRIPDAQGNFVWLPAGEATLDVAAEFEAAGLIVRPFAGDGIRISVGEHESVEKVLHVAETVVRNVPPGHPGVRASVER